MSQYSTRSHRQAIKKFESRVLNRSCADLLFYDRIADYLLQLCSTQTKPNILSILSLIPIVACYSTILLLAQVSWWQYLICSIGLFLHQIFDIANKKQAYRLSQFTLATYYIDHLCDSLTCLIIVQIICKLLLFSNQTTLTCMYFFGMLPFFTHHLAMYTNGYLTFDRMSPAVQGLLFFEILLVICSFIPSLPNTIIILNLKFSSIIVILCSLWLLVFLVNDILSIAKMKNLSHSYQQYGSEDKMPLKNLFVIAMLGYVLIESTTIQKQLLSNSAYFVLFVSIITLVYTFLISEIVLAYGCSQKLRQITGSILTVSFLVVVFYSIVGLVKMDPNDKITLGNIVMGVILGIQFIYFIYYHHRNVKFINKALIDEE